jgi:hypothetical protein
MAQLGNSFVKDYKYRMDNLIDGKNTKKKREKHFAFPAS